MRHHLNSPVCENPLPFPTAAPVSKPLTMALEAETKTIVKQFEFTDADVNKATKEFVRQLRRSTLPEMMRKDPDPRYRGGLGEGWHQLEPDSYLRHGSTKWH